MRFEPYSTSSLLIYNVNESENWSPLVSVKNLRRLPPITYVSSNINVYLQFVPANSSNRFLLSLKLINGS